MDGKQRLDAATFRPYGRKIARPGAIFRPGTKPPCSATACLRLRSAARFATPESE